MRKSNGKSEVETKELDLEHELPPADANDSPLPQSGTAVAETSAAETELQKVKA